MNKFYIFLENRLKLHTYKGKLIFIFSLIFLLSILIYSIFDFTASFNKKVNFAKKGISNAVKIRHDLLEKRLVILSSSFNTSHNIPDKCKTDFKYYLCEKSIVIKTDNSYIFVSKEKIKDILDSSKGMVSIFSPYFDISLNENNNQNICSFLKIKNSNFGISGCIDKSFLFSQIIKELSVKYILLFSIFLISSYLLFRFVFKDVVLFPVYYLNRKTKNMGISCLEKERFDLHKFIKDEFGELSKTLEIFRNKIVDYQNKIALVLNTTSKMVSFTNDIYRFMLFTINKIDEIFKTKGGIIIIYDPITDKEDTKIHSERFIQNNLWDIKGLSVLLSAFKKDNKDYSSESLDGYFIELFKHNIKEGKQVIYAIILENKLERLDISYIKTILMHLIYSINLLNLANYDTLTKLLNRNAMVSRLNKEIKRARRYGNKLSLILIDIDNFKHINDTYGHIAGDIILKNFAELLKAYLREVDIISRWGGEEILIMLPETSLEEAKQVAEKLREIIQNHKFQIKDFSINITASFGVSSFKEHGENIEELIKSADISLYKAKKEGKNNVIVLPRNNIDDILHSEFLRKTELEKIIEDNQLVPFFQGIYSVETKDVFGFEVLARVKTKYGYMPASKFIPDMIKFGLAEKVDIEVQKKTIEYLSENKINNYKIFLNLSKAYIHNIKNFENFINLCEKLNFNPENIVFEITEEEAISDTNTVREIIRMSKNKGIQFALDDFGAGYSTFSYIKIFDIDYIKFDGSLVKNIATNKDNEIILEGIIHISKLKNIKTVAEWVETEEDFNILKKLGVDYAQGYLLSKPAPEIEL